MGGAEQLPLFDSPVSGMVLAPHQGAKPECNRPDQLRQCRDHCYSDLGFLLPVTTSPPLGLAVVFAIAQSPPLNGTAPRQEYRCPGAVPWRQHYRRTVYSHLWHGCETALSQTPVTWTPPAPPARRRTYWGHERTNEHHPSHVRVYSCPNVQLTPTSAIS